MISFSFFTAIPWVESLLFEFFMSICNMHMLPLISIHAYILAPASGFFYLIYVHISVVFLEDLKFMFFF